MVSTSLQCFTPYFLLEGIYTDALLHATLENVLILQSSIFAARPCLPKSIEQPDPKAIAALHEEEADLMDRSVFLRACFAGNLEQIDLAAVRLGKAVARFFESR
jgi:hypothetical protein